MHDDRSRLELAVFVELVAAVAAAAVALVAVIIAATSEIVAPLVLGGVLLGLSYHYGSGGSAQLK